MSSAPREHAARRSPMAAGGALALASALAFGATTPFVQRFGRGLGPFTTAAILYLGAALFSALARSRRDPIPLRTADVPRLLAVAALGAVVAPVALAWGLQRTSGVSASLLLNLEAVFTVLLARALWAEPIGGRAGSALLLMTAGGVLLVAHALGEPDGAWPSSAPAAGWGLLAVALATFAWAADNTVGRPLADRDPARVVLAKGSLGAVASTALAFAFHEPLPSLAPAAALAACGALGYGASLALYLRAQRAIGAARTASIFAAAPFAGALLAWTLGQRTAGWPTIFACLLFVVGLWLHLTEHHEHRHTHEEFAHSHAHSHDPTTRDGHHDHPHDGDASVTASATHGEHTHPHRHEPMTHAHAHGLDEHHRHRH